jgi:Flp pilus assembly protein TadD
MAYDYASLNLFHDAEMAIHKAAALTDDTARVENFLGNICFLKGDLPSAVTHYRRAVDLDPVDSDLRETLEMFMKRVPIAAVPTPGAGEHTGDRSEGVETEMELYWRK